ncbi:hypothetical protein [Streptomyces sp. NPDC087512]|uniref:hypothetical protein n=1 Tax=unclassified Streptomyces TaxID=2593676 RepID=UPI0034154555
MAVEYWHAYVADRLRPFIDLSRRGYAERRAAGDLNTDPVPGAVEWTLPYGMDDGNGLVRLTVFTEVVPETHERRIRVVVAAAARGWLQDNGKVALPRFTDWGSDYARLRRDDTAAAPGGPGTDGPLTRGMAQALGTAVGGLPGTLRPEPGGEVSFAVTVRSED